MVARQLEERQMTTPTWSHNQPVLTEFRRIADAMAGAPRTWQWIGPHMSQRMFGITEARAKAYAQRHGGEARLMEVAR
jgi:hypothetical protein